MVAENGRTKLRISAEDAKRIGEAVPGIVQSDEKGFYFLATKEEAAKIRAQVEAYGMQFSLEKVTPHQKQTLESKIGFTMSPRWSYALAGLGLATLLTGEVVFPLINTGIIASDRPYRYSDMFNFQLLAATVLLPICTFVGGVMGYLRELEMHR